MAQLPSTHLAGHQEGGAVGAKLVEEGAEEVERLQLEQQEGSALHRLADKRVKMGVTGG